MPSAEPVTDHQGQSGGVRTTGLCMKCVLEGAGCWRMDNSSERWRSAWRGGAGTLPANSHKSWLNHARVSIQPKAFSRGFDFIMDIDSVRDYSLCVESSWEAW